MFIVLNNFIKKIIFSNLQLFLNYGVDLSMPRKKRQAILKKLYYFTCKCEACDNDWKGNPEKWKVNSKSFI